MGTGERPADAPSAVDLAPLIEPVRLTDQRQRLFSLYTAYRAAGVLAMGMPVVGRSTDGLLHKQQPDTALDLPGIVGLRHKWAVIAEIARGLPGRSDPGCQNHFYTGPLTSNPLRQAESVQTSRHAHVREYDVNGLLISEHLDSLFCIAGFDDPESTAPQELRSPHADQDVVLDDKHGRTSIRLIAATPCRLST